MNRREFLKASSILVSATGALAAPVLASAQQDEGGAPLMPTALHWLGGLPPDSFIGTTWGVPWPAGRLKRLAIDSFSVGAGHPVQSWPLAYWPDGSIKWSAHALAPSADEAVAPGYRLSAGPAEQVAPWWIEDEQGISLNTGKLNCTVRRSGRQFIEALHRDGALQGVGAHLVAWVDEGDAEAGDLRRVHYESVISDAQIEQAGPARVVIKVTGAHARADGHAVLPFALRVYFYRNSDAVRFVHSFTFDLDARRESIRGIGLRFDVPMAGPAHERYVRFVGDNGGVFAEAVRGLTGLRRDIGAEAAQAQMAGQSLPAIKPVVAKDIAYVPQFGSYTLAQTHPDGFTIEKRTGSGAGWIRAATGARAAGTGYLGTPQGGVAFGLRNFWQSYPAQLDIVGAQTDLAQVTLWLWSPKAPGMDLRFYHDGLGEQDYTSQLRGLDITYEDYEPGFGSAFGIGRSSELEIQLTTHTPGARELVAIARRIQDPPLLIASPERLHQGQAFSTLWAPRGQERAQTPLHREMDWCFEYYRDQVAQRSWYGFWDYGDVMHTYDAYRHVWRYDVGGYAWDNSELSTEIWLWHYFLHTGRHDAFRLAEAMTRHVSEVDVHHAGPFSPLGSRHNVQHWGDSAKQLRISTAINKRVLYYLTADERTGDLLREQVDAVKRLQQVIPGRKVGQLAPSGPDAGHTAAVAFGTDWGAIAAAWFAEWERTGQPQYRDRLLASMASIAAQPHGFFTGTGYMDLRTGAFAIQKDAGLAVSHLSAAFGLPEICSELVRAVPDQAFRKAWLDYCILYNAPPQAQLEALGKSLGALNLGQGHAKLLGYAGEQVNDPEMRKRAWALFFQGHAGVLKADFVRTRINVPEVLAPVDEAATISTNAVAQWGLAAIALLAAAPRELVYS